MKPIQHLPSLRQLHVFEAVARHKSIGRAAASVSLSQPAVTQAISSLESRFGVMLFERGRSGSYLTDFGKILLARTERLFDFIRQGLRRLLGSHQSSDCLPVSLVLGVPVVNHNTGSGNNFSLAGVAAGCGHPLTQSPVAHGRNETADTASTTKSLAESVGRI